MKLTLRQKLLILILKAYAKLPYRGVYYFGMGVGWLLSFTNIKVMHVIKCNLNACFPKLDAKSMRKLQRETMQHTVVRVLEMLYFCFSPLAKIEALIQSVEGEHYLREAGEKSEPVLTLFLHYGAWEVSNYYFGSRYSASVLYKAPKDAFQEYMVKQSREKTQYTKTHPASAGGIRGLVEDIKKARVLAIAPDHKPPDSSAVISQFFECEVQNMTFVSQLANKYHLKSYFVNTVRLPKGCGFVIKLEPVTDQKFYSQDLAESALALNQCIEKIICDNIAQYEWSYKRFRHIKGFYDKQRKD